MQRVIVITGGTSGIGAKTVELFRQNGDLVVILSKEETFDDKYFMHCDVSNEQNVKECFEKIKEQYGKVDVLFNNAGFGLNGVLELIPMDKVRAQFDVNVYGVILCTKYCLPLMSKGAKIINMSSCSALFPLPYRSMYAATKSAVFGLTISQGMELSPLGIECVAVCPGDVKTNFTKNKTVVTLTNDRYGDGPKNAQEKLDCAKKEQKRMPAIKVAKAVFKIANKKHNKSFVIVGGKFKLLYFASRFVPKSLIINATKKISM